MPDSKPSDSQTKPEGEQQRQEGLIPRPPSKADLDQVSRDQALIADEWAGDDPGNAPGHTTDEPTEKAKN